MVTRAELKSRAKFLLRQDEEHFWKSNRFWKMFAICLIVSLILGASEFIKSEYDMNLQNFIVQVFIYPLISLGVTTACKRLYEINQVEVSDMFSTFSDFKNYKVIVITILYGLLIIVGTMLFIVPGIIWSLMYSQVYNIFADDNSLGIFECMKKSRLLMRGHKFELLVLGLSFIPWGLLVVVTFGIAGIYVVPYTTVTYYCYFAELRRESEIHQRGEIK